MIGIDKICSFDIETSEQAQDDKIVPITVASTVTSDGEERAWFSDPADPAIVGMIGKGRDETWENYSPNGRPLAPIMSESTARAMLKYMEEKVKQGYALTAWNGAGFDLKMIGYLAKEIELAGKLALGLYDPMYQILTQKGFPLGLAAVQKGLGIAQAKSMDGKDAPEAWAKGEFKKVIGYVIGDSQITIQVVLAIIKSGGIQWTTKSGKPSSVTFRKLKTVAECLLEPDVSQSWQTNPIDRRKIISWVSSDSQSKATNEAEKAEAKNRGDADVGFKPVLLVVSGPSGVGKNVLCDELLRTVKGIKRSVTVTTRQPRKSEVNGVDYHFVTEEKFNEMVKNGDFLEWAEVHGNKYGSSKSDVSSRLGKKQDVIMIVDVQGGKNIRSFYANLPEATKSKFCFADVFISPPSIDHLKKRLLDRKTETPDDIEKRVQKATEEIKQASFYKYTVINDDMNKAWDRLRSIVVAERCRSAS